MVIPNLIGLGLAAFITLSRVPLSSPGRGAAVLAAAIDAVTVIGDGAAAPSRPYTAGHVTVPVIQTAKGVKKSIVVFDRTAEAYASGRLRFN